MLLYECIITKDYIQRLYIYIYMRVWYDMILYYTYEYIPYSVVDWNKKDCLLRSMAGCKDS